MNCKIMGRVLKDRKVINGEKRERNIGADTAFQRG